MNSIVLTLAITALVPFQQAHAQPVPLDFEQISLSRTLCYGSCPVYSVEIKADGSITYDGQMNVVQVGARTGTITAAEFAFLRSAVKYAGFQDLQSSYAREEDGCKTVSTDSSSMIISIRQGAIVKSVNYYLGCNGPKAALERIKWLAYTIDQVAGTRRWVAEP